MKHLPRYVEARKLSGGKIAFYWIPAHRDKKKPGCPQPEPLGSDLEMAIRRAKLLNQNLDAWRLGSDKSPQSRAGFGTVDWVVDVYLKSRAFERVSERTRPDYIRALGSILDMPSKTGARLGGYLASQVTAQAVDRVYERLIGDKGRVRSANLAIAIIARAWSVAHRLHPKDVPPINPWRGVIKQSTGGTKKPATRDQAYALAHALAEIGHPKLGAVPVICFEWLQRPENVIASFTRENYRPAYNPDCVEIVHAKTGVSFWVPLFDEQGPLYPEAISYLDKLDWSGRLVDFKPRHVHALVRRARSVAGLPDHITLAACRHGGMTELGDAQLTEQSVMALSGHKTPQASRLYVKRTERQRLDAARQRRNHVVKN